MEMTEPIGRPQFVNYNKYTWTFVICISSAKWFHIVLIECLSLFNILEIDMSI